MTRFQLLKYLSAIVRDELVVTNLKGTAHEWHHLSGRKADLYYMGMGVVTPVAIGLAMALPRRRVIALDGDGSLLLDLSALTAIPVAGVPNLVVIVFDNQCYESNGALPTVTSGSTDLAGIARASGVKSVHNVGALDHFSEVASMALSEAGPHFILARVDGGTKKVPITMNYGRYNTFQFVKHIEETEEVEILRSIKATGRAYTPTAKYYLPSEDK